MENPPSPPKINKEDEKENKQREDSDKKEDKGPKIQVNNVELDSDDGGRQLTPKSQQQKEEDKKSDKGSIKSGSPQQPKEEDKKEQDPPEPILNNQQQAKDMKLTESSKYYNKNLLVANQRSNLLTKNDRHQLEKDVMKQIESGGGIFGRKKINLDAHKKKFLKIDDKKELPQDDTLIKLLNVDGIYVDNTMQFKNKDINVQKLEERLLKNGQSEYFKLNGQLKLNNDILANELTRPADLAFEQTDAFQIVERNAIVTDRLNSFKRQYYCIDIIIGKIILKEYKPLIPDEDLMVLRLKHLCKLYDRRVGLALIPFLIEKKEFLRDTIKAKREDQESEQDIEYLETMLTNVEKEFKDERDAIQDAANQIYSLWTQITELQKKKETRTSPYELKVHRGEQGADILFNVNQTHIYDNEETVKAQKLKVEKVPAYCKLIIDGKFVAKTQVQKIQWPNYEIDMLDQFQIHVFTLPSKVELEIYMNNKMVDIINIEIPGSHVKTLTSASRLIREYEFSRKQNFINQRKKRGIVLDKEEELMNPQEKASFNNELPKVDKINVSGSVFLKAEWHGYGEMMPPARSETLFTINQIEKNRNYYTKQEEFELLKQQKAIDVNDPRNELIIKHMRNMKNDYMDKLLDQDTKFLLSDLDSFRHMLIKARNQDPSCAYYPIPQLNSELINTDKNKFYIEWLEEVHRQETYKNYLAKKAQIQQQNLVEDQQMNSSRGHQVFDIETLQRRQVIFDKINKRKKQSATGVMANKQANYDAVVSEFIMQDAEVSILTIIKNLFVFERQLKPKVKERKQTAIDSVSEAKLLIHVIRGQDVPVRQSYYDKFLRYIQNRNDGGKDSNKAYQELYFNKQAETFLEIRLHDPETGHEMIKRTCVSEGQYPEWNELLEFVLSSKGVAFTKHELQQSKIMIHFTLFDQEIKVDQITKMTKNISKQNRYLGSFKIPLTTILIQTKFEGNIRLERPLVLQDYHVVQDELVFMDQEEIERQQGRNEEQIPSYINLSITFEPLIRIPIDNDREYYNGKESPLFLETCCQFARQVTKPYVLKPRFVKLFLENVDGMSVFIPRFLTPIRPPDEIYKKEDNRAIERAARYVSLIPFIDDAQLFKDMPDLTCTCQEFLDLGAGDDEEHAILLCNYFNFIDKEQGREDFESYIVYGDAIPDGITWYVLRRDKKQNNVEIWNPNTGEAYNFDFIQSRSRGGSKTTSRNQRIFDPQCTMKKLWCVVGMSNVWANIQKEENPVQIKFDLNNVKEWKPFLDKKNAKKFFGDENIQLNNITVQTNAPNIHYQSPITNTAMLEEQIKKFIAGRFEDERIKQVKKTTNWNIRIEEELKNVLLADKELQSKYLKEVKETFEDFDRRHANKYGTFKPYEAICKKYFVGQNFDEVLRDFEDYAACARKGATTGAMRNKNQDKDEDIRASIVQEFINQIAGEVQKKCWAIPINCTMLSLDGIWDAVKNTRFHEYDNHEVEFSISVSLKAYPCNIISVWIYIAMFIDDFEEEQF